ncbi:hypothetical protein F5878DRAFT_637699 [Lentinula raphanica]|uniref:Uncharacterized protein n=1 Tax=Lentinula raphanica TaxID=153919 RepID=A0AA38PK66_9AGAR|nr:hypothetical protein F5880DRAFT_1508015 [Lentinula raphanica]KAJ3843996.1 hypothetical protein F5878DRAFT_637699 [Lentinula raphanica]
MTDPGRAEKDAIVLILPPKMLIRIIFELLIAMMVVILFGYTVLAIHGSYGGSDNHTQHTKEAWQKAFFDGLKDGHTEESGVKRSWGRWNLVDMPEAASTRLY